MDIFLISAVQFIFQSTNDHIERRDAVDLVAIPTPPYSSASPEASHI